MSRSFYIFKVVIFCVVFPLLTFAENQNDKTIANNSDEVIENFLLNSFIGYCLIILIFSKSEQRKNYTKNYYLKNIKASTH
jgi:hypothetical protein